MRTILSSVLFLCLSVAAFAQSDTTAPVKKRKVEHDLHINTTFFFKQIISLSSANLEISPYIIGYKVFPGKHHGLRLAVGGNFTSHKTDNGNSFKQTTKGSELDYRIGYEFARALARGGAFSPE